MPIIEVEIVEPIEAKGGLPQLLADAAGGVLKTGPGHTWVKIRFMSGDQYAENGGTPAEIKPVFVSVLLGNGRNEEEKALIASGMAAAFSRDHTREAPRVTRPAMQHGS